MDQIIIHVDMDAFYASVEMRDNFSLRGKPLIIGSLPNERGVVATCSYEARRYGVRSAMNIKEAYRLCPNGIYMHPDFEKYKKVSRQLHEIWKTYASALESIALDEAYLDVTQRAGNFEHAREIAYLIKERTRNELGLTCSVGLAYSKTAAKTASEEKKPDGFYEILSEKDFVSLIAHRDVRALYTVGEKTAEKLHKNGIFTVHDVCKNPETVKQLLGKQGSWIVKMAGGKDERRVTPYRPEDAKSISREVTFQEDVTDFGLLRDVLFLLALCVEDRARRVKLYGKGVSLKVTYGDMKSISRSRHVDNCETAEEIYAGVLELLEKVEQRRVRLIGAGIYDLSAQKHRQLSLFDLSEDMKPEGTVSREEMFETFRKRYGPDFIGHVHRIARTDALHRTVDFMRRHPSSS